VLLQAKKNKKKKRKEKKNEKLLSGVLRIICNEGNYNNTDFGW
jgi:hypothetical protein